LRIQVPSEHAGDDARRPLAGFSGRPASRRKQPAHLDAQKPATFFEPLGDTTHITPPIIDNPIGKQTSLT
jgi:hypothetical protein